MGRPTVYGRGGACPRPGRNWLRPACRATARVAPTIHEWDAQPYTVGAGLAPALGATRGAAINPIAVFLNLTPMGRRQARPPAPGRRQAHAPTNLLVHYWKSQGGGKLTPLLT